MRSLRVSIQNTIYIRGVNSNWYTISWWSANQKGVKKFQNTLIYIQKEKKENCEMERGLIY